MIFGFTEERLKELGAEFTGTEIRQQPKLWRETYKIITDNKNKIEEFLNKNITSNTRIILTGAGTSDYVGDSVYLHLAKTLKLRVEAIATTDLVSNPQEFLEEDTKTILVSYARSGNSPESVGAYDIFQENVKDIAQLVITCNENGELAKKSMKDDNALCLLMPKESNDKSFAMTSSFSCMLLATLLAFDIKNLEENKKYVDRVSDQADLILDNKWNEVKDLVDLNCERVVYLGSGALKGLCQEMALKNLELTSGKTVTVCESVLGFRHGPKSIINDNTLVIFMNSNNEYTSLYDMDLIREIHGDIGNHKLAVISYKKNDELSSLCDKYLEIDGQEVPEVYTVFNYMLFGQMFGLFSSLHLGISPDNPRPDGTVNRVVKGVIIHPYNK
ncbi:SIS domain-containing protein [Clostridium sardiniense]|uniref:SIS domain-containing protein n=1 Tax=Clostridium sardiniense TaxID=29369 RepID=UPI00195744DB|nr:SIS domain-containing protein [Clostridium sardiniense]MBM7835794.1 tagatose-6-phosphate ketose/aldose isomerase [Clostridium sardiniense]